MSKVILFAGAAGCGKTPVATYLSWQLGLPVFANDPIRSEVHEDKKELQLDVKDYEKRRDERLHQLIQGKQNFIFDASIDREWGKHKPRIVETYQYEPIIISFDLSKQFLLELYKSKEDYKTDDEYIERYHSQHQAFLNDYADDIDLSINDENYINRLELSLKLVKDRLK